MNDQSYYTIERRTQAEFKDRGSRFIGMAFPVTTVEETKQLLQEVRKQHPKASHCCFAYRLGIDGQLFRANDDGEPSGSAGKPILGQIDSRELTDVLLVVVRYFGGTLLGIPGLIHAYKNTAALALQLTPRLQKTVEKQFELRFDYTIINEVLQMTRQHQCSILEQDLQLFCRLLVGVPAGQQELFLHRLREIKNLECMPVAKLNGVR